MDTDDVLEIAVKAFAEAFMSAGIETARILKKDIPPLLMPDGGIHFGRQIKMINTVEQGALILLYRECPK